MKKNKVLLVIAIVVIILVIVLSFVDFRVIDSSYRNSVITAHSVTESLETVPTQSSLDTENLGVTELETSAEILKTIEEQNFESSDTLLNTTQGTVKTEVVFSETTTEITTETSVPTETETIAPITTQASVVEDSLPSSRPIYTPEDGSFLVHTEDLGNPDATGRVSGLH